LICPASSKEQDVLRQVTALNIPGCTLTRQVTSFNPELTKVKTAPPQIFRAQKTVCGAGF
jgi:hypothetical protein